MSVASVAERSFRAPGRVMALASAWERAVGVDAPSPECCGFSIREFETGAVRLSWPLLERAGRSAPVEVDVCLATGAISCPRPFAHWTDVPRSTSHVVVVPDIFTFLAFCQARARESIFPFVVVAPVTGGELPHEWHDRRYWDFERITILSDGLAEPAASLPLLAGMDHHRAGVAVRDDGGAWRSWAGALRRLEHDTLADVEAGALPVADFRDISVGEEGTAAWLRRRCRSLDDQGRLCRAASLPLPRGLHAADETVLVRSDGTCAKVAPRQHRHALHESGVSTNDAANGWRPASVASFLDRGGVPTSVELGSMLAGALAPLLAGDAHASRIVAAYVALTYAFPAFEQLPLLWIRGGVPGNRFAMRRLLAAICHEPTVVARTRAMQLARIADAGSGVLILNEPGPLCGPSGALEVGRFLEGALVRDASAYNAVSTRAGLRTLDVFGPKILLAERGVVSGVAVPVVTVDLPADAGAPSFALGAEQAAELRDALYMWSMRNAADRAGRAGLLTADDVLPAIYRELYGADAIKRAAEREGVGQALDATAVVQLHQSPAEVMAAIVDACGGGYLAMVQVMLEIALRGGDDASLSPERVGRWLAAHPAVDAGRPTERRRLHGQISRIYPLVTPHPGDADPATAFDFCLGRTCGECRYDSVCGSTFPDLRRRKLGA